MYLYICYKDFTHIRLTVFISLLCVFCFTTRRLQLANDFFVNFLPFKIIYQLINHILFHLFPILHYADNAATCVFCLKIYVYVLFSNRSIYQLASLDNENSLRLPYFFFFSAVFAYTANCY